MRKEIMVSMGVLCAATPNAVMAEVFPVIGTYEGVSTYAGQEQRFREKNLNISTKELFTKFILGAVAGSNCRDIHYDVANGSIRVTATCDTSDRDFRGIKTSATGNYNSSSFRVSNTFLVLGKPAVHTVSARLVEPR